MVDRPALDVEHQVRQQRARDAADDLRHGVRADVGQAQPRAGTPAQEPVREGDDRVEMRTRDRTEQQDQHGQPQRRCGRVLQQLESHVVRRQPLGGDAGPDDHRDQQPRAQELGKHATEKRRSRSQILVGHAQILTDKHYLSQY